MKKLALFLSFIFIISCSKEPIIYTLTTSANPSEGGTVSPTTKQYNEGETATISATPSSEYTFQSWSGATGSTNTISVVMSSDKSVTANFVKKKYTLTVEVEGEGTVSERIIKAGAATDYNSGTVVELTATPSDEWIFKEWKGDLTSTDNPAQITIDKAKKVTAIFVKKQYTLTIEINGEGTVSEKVIKQGLATDYNSGTIIELTAEPNDGWELAGWFGDVDANENPIFNIENSIQITLDGNKTVKVDFEESKIFLHDNGVTIVAKPDAEINKIYILNGKRYKIANPENFSEDHLNGKYAVNRNIGDGNFDGIVTTFVTEMYNLFTTGGYPERLPNKSIESWDTSNVTVMNGVFNGCGHYSGGYSDDGLDRKYDLTNWDVSKVTDMSFMFFRTDMYADFSSWDVSNVNSMESMFMNAKTFGSDVGDWDVSNVKTMESMFMNSRYDGNGVLNWKTNSLYNIDYIFKYAWKFNEDISSWNISHVTSLEGVFYDAVSFNQKLTWDVRHILNFDYVFKGASSLEQDYSHWCASNSLGIPVEPFNPTYHLGYQIPKWGEPCEESLIWNGSQITFKKNDGAKNDAESQDRLTKNVWITRGNNGGQIYNAAREKLSDKTNSPIGTKWAIGTLDEIDNLTFDAFRASVGNPKDVVGKNLVMFLEDHNIYLSVIFTSWSEGKNGGFSYQRSTRP